MAALTCANGVCLFLGVLIGAVGTAVLLGTSMVSPLGKLQESKPVSAQVPAAAPVLAQVETASPVSAQVPTTTLGSTEAPTEGPTSAPTLVPTLFPTTHPTAAATLAPTISPTAAPTEAPAPVSAAPTPEPTISPFNIYETAGPDFRAVDHPAHATALILESSLPVKALEEEHRYVTIYHNSDDAVAESLWKQGLNVVMHKEFDHLRIACLALDIVVINSEAPGFKDQAYFARVLNEAARVLAPLGTLILKSAVSPLPSFFLSPILQETRYPNMYRRAGRMVDGLQACGNNCFGNDGDRPVACQPVIGPEYVNLDDATRQANILKDSPLSLGRFRNVPVANVFNDRTTGWRDTAPRYVGPVGIKPEFEKVKKVRDLISSNEVDRVLDAGAGTCTLAGVLLQRGLRKKYMAFGGYNCNMLKYCGERGSFSLDWDWTHPFPFCSNCKFDFVFQAQGIHHTSPDLLTQTFDNFANAARCGGYIYVDDAGYANWSPRFKSWAAAKGYKVLQEGSGYRAGMLVRKDCPGRILSFVNAYLPFALLPIRLR
eukprot:TRINITY_DN45461_c0_g1_i1.p1 TRINITY_DN45461_c0_g1~~TRINITY_DN45461_c0_g1_i1.p1  ORF type:complete len:563 (+),score=65.71 TRINITY_DN45461_c0_g1_i1:58-1689(+)